jgi:hypothetical protein
MEYKGWEEPVTVLGVVEAPALGAAIRAGVRRWPQLHADNFFIKLKDWTTWAPKRVPREVPKPLAQAPTDDPYG